MNRWRLRLAELQGAHAGVRDVVQNVQNVQNPTAAPTFGHSEQVEQPIDNLQAPSNVWSEAEEECAAIIEYGAGVPRAWADALARLDPSTPPAGVPYEDWINFIDACGRFIDARWHIQANALGWEPVELFGCDRVNPFDKVEAKGLLWHIRDGNLVALTTHGALVDSGVRDLYLPRRPPMPGQVLTWELPP
jgi:hypothetical protein